MFDPFSPQWYPLMLLFLGLILSTIIPFMVHEYKKRRKTVESIKEEAKTQVFYLISQNDDLIQHLIDKRAQQISDEPEKYMRRWIFSRPVEF